MVRWTWSSYGVSRLVHYKFFQISRSGSSGPVLAASKFGYFFFISFFLPLCSLLDYYFLLVLVLLVLLCLCLCFSGGKSFVLVLSRRSIGSWKFVTLYLSLSLYSSLKYAWQCLLVGFFSAHRGIFVQQAATVNTPIEQLPILLIAISFYSCCYPFKCWEAN